MMETKKMTYLKRQKNFFRMYQSELEFVRLLLKPNVEK